MNGELWIPGQVIPTTNGLNGSAYEARFPTAIPERPYLGPAFLLQNIHLRLGLTFSYEEIATSPRGQAFLELRRQTQRLWTTAIDLEGLTVITGTLTGEATIYTDFVNAIAYGHAETLQLGLSGVLGGTDTTKTGSFTATILDGSTISYERDV